MKKSIFIDYNNNIKLNLSYLNNKCDFSYSCNIDSIPAKNLIENLSKITKIIEKGHNNYNVYLNNCLFLKINFELNEYHLLFKLTTFEVRCLGQGLNKKVPSTHKIYPKLTPVTDVHTHFTGALPADILIKVGKKHNISLNKTLLKKLGIDVSGYEEKNVLLSELNQKSLRILKSKMILSPVTQETFNSLEDAYYIRGIFTKNKLLFKDLLKELALYYRRNGIMYAEVSFASIINKDYLTICEEALPVLEKQIGVTIRFLASIWRYSIPAERRKYIKKLLNVLPNKYIVGCDFMGREATATNSFSWEISTLVKETMYNNVEFIIRVHAGENPLYKNNVYDALKIVLDTYDTLKTKTTIKPKIRIGHGIYNCDNKTIRLLKKLDAIVEFNISSNFALNNIEKITDLPIKKYLNKDVKVVLSSDGYGLYSTDPIQEVILASLAGLKYSDFKTIRSVEKELIYSCLMRDKKENSKLQLSDYLLSYNELVEQLDEIDNEDKTNLSDVLASDIEINKATRGKIPVAILGSTYKGWLKTPLKTKEKIIAILDKLIKDIDYDKVYIVTGGINFGVEKEVHNICKNLNYQAKNKIMVLGLLPKEASKNSNEPIANDSLTYISVLKNNYSKVNLWQEVPIPLVKYIKENKGILICIGGGMIISDIIQTAYNEGANFQIMSGVSGASSAECANFSQDYKFDNYNKLKKNLLKINKKIFKKSK